MSSGSKLKVHKFHMILNTRVKSLLWLHSARRSPRTGPSGTSPPPASSALAPAPPSLHCPLHNTHTHTLKICTHFHADPVQHSSAVLYKTTPHMLLCLKYWHPSAPSIVEQMFAADMGLLSFLPYVRSFLTPVLLPFIPPLLSFLYFIFPLLSFLSLLLSLAPFLPILRYIRTCTPSIILSFLLSLLSFSNALEAFDLFYSDFFFPFSFFKTVTETRL